MGPNTPQDPNINPTPELPTTPPQVAQPQEYTPVAPQQPMPPAFNQPMPQASVPFQPQVPPATPSMPMQPSPKSKKPLLFIGAIVLIAVLVAGAFILKGGSKNPSGSSQTSQKGEEVVVDSLSDYEVVCKGGTASNASDYTGVAPHPIMFLRPSAVFEDQYSQIILALKNKEAMSDYENPTAIQLVGCFSVKDKQKTKTCQMKVSGDTMSDVDYYSVTYELNIYEAKSNKKVGTKSVSGTADSCPFIASLNKDDPKILADPDDTSADAAVTEYIIANL